jgi:hypothetical protein
MRWFLVGAATVISSVALLLGSNMLLDHSETFKEALAQTLDDAVCKLEFVKYISSEWEQQWAKNANRFVEHH